MNNSIALIRQGDAPLYSIRVQLNCDYDFLTVRF